MVLVMMMVMVVRRRMEALVATQILLMTRNAEMKIDSHHGSDETIYIKKPENTICR